MRFRDIFRRRAVPDVTPSEVYALEAAAHEAYGAGNCREAHGAYVAVAETWEWLAQSESNATKQGMWLGRAEHCWRLAAGSCDRVADSISRHPSRDAAAAMERDRLGGRRKN